MEKNGRHENREGSEMDQASRKSCLFEGFFGETGKEVEDGLFSNNNKKEERRAEEREAQNIAPFYNK